jgi:hypothetical protein
MSNELNFDEALRKQREAFADRYASNPILADTAAAMDAMFAQDEAEPVANYAARRGV